MRKLLLAVGVLTLLAAPAFAVSLPASASPFKAKISDYSAVYRATDTINGPVAPVLSPVPISAPTDAVKVGDEQRTIFRVTNIFDKTDVNEVFNLSAPTELTGVLYDLKVISVFASGSAIVIDFGRASRNPLTADVVGADPTSGLVGAVSGFDYKAQVGGVLEVYEDSAKNFSPNPNGVATYTSKIAVGGTPPPIPFDAGAAPTLWAQGGAGHAPTTDGTTPVDADDFTRTTDGSYWLAGQLIPLQFLVEAGILEDPTLAGGAAYTSGTLLRETLPTDGNRGAGSGYVNIAGGSRAGANFLEGFGGNFVDVTMSFNLHGAIYDAIHNLIKRNPDYVGVGQWTVESEDPVRFATGSTIPEPATLSLLGIGIAGLASRIRSRK